MHDYCTPLSLDGFPNATTLLSLSFELHFTKVRGVLRLAIILLSRYWHLHKKLQRRYVKITKIRPKITHEKLHSVLMYPALIA